MIAQQTCEYGDEFDLGEFGAGTVLRAVGPGEIGARCGGHEGFLMRRLRGGGCVFDRGLRRSCWGRRRYLAGRFPEVGVGPVVGVRLEGEYAWHYAHLRRDDYGSLS